jgi:hypothetical protein
MLKLVGLCALTLALCAVLALSSGTSPYEHCGNEAKDAQAFKECVDVASAESLADYTEWLAWFTAALAIASVVQGYFIWKQISLANAEFIATHRPKIRVRQILAQNFTDPNRAFEIGFHCVNVGDSPCKIEEIAYQVRPMAFDGRPILRPGQFQRQTSVPKGARLEVGEAVPVTTPSLTVPHITNGFWDVAGYILYSDDAGVIRQTGFWQRFEHRIAEQAGTPNNSDYRYED